VALVGAVKFAHLQGPQFYQVAEQDLARGQQMVAPTRFGSAVGHLLATPYALLDGAPPDEWARPARPEDLARADSNLELAAESLEACSRHVARHRLPMKLVQAFWSLDRQQLTVFYSAPSRVDFRALLRDLVREFRVALRLEQIGERDAARVIGGLGRCGRVVCCRQWMPRFEAISVNHARDQGLLPLPQQLAGRCGRLRCCLRFELDDGEELSLADLCAQSNPRKPIKTATYHTWYEEDDEPVLPDLPEGAR